VGYTNFTIWYIYFCTYIYICPTVTVNCFKRIFVSFRPFQLAHLTGLEKIMQNALFTGSHGHDLALLVKQTFFKRYIVPLGCVYMYICSSLRLPRVYGAFLKTCLQDSLSLFTYRRRPFASREMGTFVLTTGERFEPIKTGRCDSWHRPPAGPCERVSLTHVDS